MFLACLEQTAFLFTPIAIAYRWIHQAAKILDNEAGLDATVVKRSYLDLLAQMSDGKHKVDRLEPGITTKLKITRSYWSGLFHCYKVVRVSVA